MSLEACNNEESLDLTSFPLLRIDQLHRHQLSTLLSSEKEISCLLLQQQHNNSSSSKEITMDDGNNNGVAPPSIFFSDFLQKLISMIQKEIYNRVEQQKTNHSCSTTEEAAATDRVMMLLSSTSNAIPISNEMISCKVMQKDHEKAKLFKKEDKISNDISTLKIDKNTNFTALSKHNTQNSCSSSNLIHNDTNKHKELSSAPLKEKNMPLVSKNISKYNKQKNTYYTVGGGHKKNDNKGDGGGSLRQRAKMAMISIKQRKKYLNDPDSNINEQESLKETLRQERKRLALERIEIRRMKKNNLNISKLKLKRKTLKKIKSTKKKQQITIH